jgi:hypothetical protein
MTNISHFCGRQTAMSTLPTGSSLFEVSALLIVSLARKPACHLFSLIIGVLCSTISIRASSMLWRRPIA